MYLILKLTVYNMGKTQMKKEGLTEREAKKLTADNLISLIKSKSEELKNLYKDNQDILSEEVDCFMVLGNRGMADCFMWGRGNNIFQSLCTCFSADPDAVDVVLKALESVFVDKADDAKNSFSVNVKPTSTTS